MTSGLDLKNLAHYYWHAWAGPRPMPLVGCPGAVNIGRAGYPDNHNFQVCGGRLLPNYPLFRRLRRIIRLFPKDMDSLLDVGCCRGAFVLSAAREPACQRAVGIDVKPAFVETARAAQKALGVENAHFQLLRLGEFVDRLGELGGPFHTVLVTGLYHYLFWGSEKFPDGYMDHDRILSMLATLSVRQVIFSGRLEIDECPTFIRAKAELLGDTIGYNSAAFLKCAAGHFDVRQVGRLGRRPLFVLAAKGPH